MKLTSIRTAVKAAYYYDRVVEQGSLPNILCFLNSHFCFNRTQHRNTDYTLLLTITFGLPVLPCPRVNFTRKLALNTHDLIAVRYLVWTALQKLVYFTKFQTLTS